MTLNIGATNLLLLPKCKKIFAKREGVCTVPSPRLFRRMTDMDEDNYKFTDFAYYCPRCKHCDKKEDEEPCDECLAVGARPNTKKPERFEEK